MSFKTKTRETVFTAIAAAVICVAAPFSIPLPAAVPLSLASLAVYIAGALLGRTRGVLAVVIYLLVGLVGMPVFSGFMGGASVLFGITGGFIIGYIPCVFLTGLFSERFGGRILLIAVGMALGTLALYLFGTAWFMLFTGADLTAAVFACVVPFLVGDVLKISAVAMLCTVLRKKLSVVKDG